MSDDAPETPLVVDPPPSSSAPTKTLCLACGGVYETKADPSPGSTAHGTIFCRWCDEGYQTPKQARRWLGRRAAR